MICHELFYALWNAGISDLIVPSLFIKVKHLRTNYKVLNIEVDGGLGIPTIETAAQVCCTCSVRLMVKTNPLVLLQSHLKIYIIGKLQQQHDILGET